MGKGELEERQEWKRNGCGESLRRKEREGKEVLKCL